MKHQSISFNKQSRLIIAPELEEEPDERLRPLEPETLKSRLSEALRVQNDFFPCFDWVFPPPYLSKEAGPRSAGELFAHASVVPGTYAIYLHVPFCKTLCSFCYYPVLAGKGIQQSETYVDYLLREMSMYREAVAGQICESIYLGGGTPTYLDDALLVRLFEGLRKSFDLAANVEISIESAPGTLPRSKVELLKSLGVTRLSYGIQTLDADLLATMNRFYSVNEALEELTNALEIIGNVNVDTMYGFDGEPEDALLKTLSTFHALGVPGLSIYGLDTQRNVKKSIFHGPPQDEHYFRKIEFFHRAEAFLAERGYEPVLQNIFVQPGRGEYRHQIRRWDNVTLLALGVGSMGYAPRTPYQNYGELKGYFGRIEEGRLPIMETEHLSAEMELAREVTTRLRFTGVDVGEVRRRYGVDLDVVFRDLLGALGELELVERRGDVIRLSAKASPYNNIIPMLLAPDSFKIRLLGLPEEYIEKMPVPNVITRIGACQSAPIKVRTPREAQATGARS